MLEIAEPNDAREPMGGAAVVPGFIAVDPEHTLASARQVLECRAAHCAQAADDDVEMAHGAVPVAKLSYRCALAMRKRTLFCERRASGGADWPPSRRHSLPYRDAGNPFHP